MNPSQIYAIPGAVAQAPADIRTAFYQRTYLHLGGAIAAMVILEAFLLSIPGIRETVFGLLSTSRYSWLIVLGAFMAATWMAEKWANSDTSKGMQYLGLGLYVIAEAVIFLPLLLIATSYSNSSALIGQAGIITGGLFAGITFVAFTTKKDFSFLGGMLKVAFFVAIGLIIAGTFFNSFELGLWFSGAMILVAGASILYQTSNIIHHYRPEQHVAASLGLFASVALLFWYVLRILMVFRSGD